MAGLMLGGRLGEHEDAPICVAADDTTATKNGLTDRPSNAVKLLEAEFQVVMPMVNGDNAYVFVSSSAPGRTWREVDRVRRKGSTGSIEREDEETYHGNQFVKHDDWNICLLQLIYMMLDSSSIALSHVVRSQLMRLMFESVLFLFLFLFSSPRSFFRVIRCK